MPVKRTRSISTKVTDAEYHALATAAEPLTISEWTRAILLKAASPNAAEPILLAEVLALRTILLNLHFAICGGRPISQETLQQLIAHADKDKVLTAQARLGLLGPQRTS
jgi:hypothetical protein